MRPVRVLIIDDSMTMRRLIRLALSGDPRIDVVGEARDAQQARERLGELRPDVLTLDVEMPGQSGLDFLERLMAVRPMPVIMVSTETHHGTAAALDGLRPAQTPRDLVSATIGWRRQGAVLSGTLRHAARQFEDDLGAPVLDGFAHYAGIEAASLTASLQAIGRA